MINASTHQFSTLMLSIATQQSNLFIRINNDDVPSMSVSLKNQSSTVENTKGSKERLFIMTQTHNLQIFGVIPFVMPQNDT